MLTNLLEKRNVPGLLPRTEMLELLQKEVYGYLPSKPESLAFTEIKFDFYTDCCRSGEFLASGTLNGREFSFPFHVTVPDDGKPHPFFVHLNFRGEKGFDMYRPTEEIITKGYAVINLCYKDVTSDDDDFTNGLAGVLYPDGQRKPTDPGKIAMWAWAAQRMMDFAENRPDLFDCSRVCICGHSRLGKTALLAGATDERFPVVCSNDSGCSGAALSRGKEGERIDRICERFPYWFCENYQQYRNREEAMPFDQHFLIAASAPRCVLVGSASLDAWADPISEQLSCLAAAPAFGGDFQCDHPAQVGETFFDGKLGYHLRKGSHVFSRTDWLRLIQFCDIHMR